MHTKLIDEQSGERTYVVVLDRGDEVMASLREFARQANLSASHFTAIGAFSDVVLGFFDPDTKHYQKTVMQQQVEVLSLLGNIAMHDDAHNIHAHVVVSKRDGTAHGGHLMEAYVRPTLEVIVVEEPQHLWRETDSATGLARLKVNT